MAVEFGSEAEQPEKGPGHSGKHLVPPLSWDHSSYQPCAGLGTGGTTLGPLTPEASAVTVMLFQHPDRVHLIT